MLLKLLNGLQLKNRIFLVIFKEDVRWIDKIRDPMWKSKVQAIHGSMKSDVESMESIFESAMCEKIRPRSKI